MCTPKHKIYINLNRVSQNGVYSEMHLGMMSVCSDYNSLITSIIIPCYQPLMVKLQVVLRTYPICYKPLMVPMWCFEHYSQNLFLPLLSLRLL